jgi:hypothetical protein
LSGRSRSRPWTSQLGGFEPFARRSWNDSLCGKNCRLCFRVEIYPTHGDRVQRDCDLLAKNPDSGMFTAGKNGMAWGLRRESNSQ